jgi:hypothetical protein
LSGTISEANKQHYEVLLRAANAMAPRSDHDIAFREV